MQRNVSYHVTHSESGQPICTVSLQDYQESHSSSFSASQRFSNCSQRHLSLEHSKPHLLVVAQWQDHHDLSCLYLGYRLFLSTYFLMWGVWSFISFGGYDFPLSKKGYYFVFLTNWSLWLLLADSTLQSYNVIAHIRRIANTDTYLYSCMPLAFKISWILSNITYTLHILITITYWTAIYNPMHHTMSATQVNTHIIPGLYVVFDLLVSATPRRFLHVFFPMGFCCIYGTFSIVYFLCGGGNHYGSSSLYPFLNWSQPSTTMMYGACIILLGIPLTHMVVCLIAVTRVAIARRVLVPKMRYGTRNNSACDEAWEDDHMV